MVEVTKVRAILTSTPSSTCILVSNRLQGCLCFVLRFFNIKGMESIENLNHKTVKIIAEITLLIVYRMYIQHFQAKTTQKISHLG